MNIAMNIDLSRFKVIYGEKVLNAIALQSIDMGEAEYPSEKCVEKPKFLEVLAINEDGNIIAIYDEAWTFQFLPIVQN